MIAKAIKEPYHPILVHLIPVRRCNLSCAYCNEFDTISKPVPVDLLLRRIDLLADLGSAAVHLSGGEPLLHPDLDRVIARITERGMLSGLLTNGYLLSRERIRSLNRAGLDYLQISVDNVIPDDVSKKSLKVLDKKLQLLAKYSEFNVSINSVLGAHLGNCEDALTVSRRAMELGLNSTIGILHDSSGQLKPLSLRHQDIYKEVQQSRKKSFADHGYYNRFQKNLMNGLPNQWHCRAGSRYLYVCEDGLVHYCSQQRGHPAIPLEEYKLEDLIRENRTAKSCAPFCTISCVHRVAVLDHFREQPLEALQSFFPPAPGQDPSTSLPPPVRLLKWMFLPSAGSKSQPFLGKLARRILGV